MYFLKIDNFISVFMHQNEKYTDFCKKNSDGTRVGTGTGKPGFVHQI